MTLLDSTAVMGAALGVLLTLNGFLLKYIFTAHTNKIDKLQQNCEKVANEVRASVSALSARVDSEVEGLDKDIKNVGAALSVQLATLTRDLFSKIDANRLELANAIQSVNNRLDGVFRPPNQN